MENASKAIIMAGGILVSIVIISLLVLLFGGIGGAYDAQNEALSIKQIEEYNRKFAKYNDTKGLYGTELLSLANLMNEYNAKLLDSVNGNADDKFYTDNKVTIKVNFYNIVGTELKDPITGKDVTNKYGQAVKQYARGSFVGLKDIKWFKDLYDNLGKAEEDGIEVDITGLKSVPFRAVSHKEPNEYGIITEWLFEQEKEER